MGAAIGAEAGRIVGDMLANSTGDGPNSDDDVVAHVLLMFVGGLIGGAIGSLIQRDAEFVGMVVKDHTTGWWQWIPAPNAPVPSHTAGWTTPASGR